MDKNIKEKNIAEIKEDDEITGFKGFLKGHNAAIKSALTIFFINIIFSLFSAMSLGFSGSQLWIGILLYVLFIASYMVMIVLCGKSSSYTAFHCKRLNDVNFKAGRTVVSYKKAREYKPYKGYIIGAVASIPLVLLILISFFFIGETYILYTGFVKFIYSIFSAPFLLINKELHVSFALVGVLMNACAFGVSYQLFGMKMQIQQEDIDNDMKRIHSELDVNGSEREDV